MGQNETHIHRQSLLYQIEDLALDERFDSISMLNILEHVLDPAVALRKAASLLRPGGAVIVHVRNADAIIRRIALAMGTLLSCDGLSPYGVNFAVHRAVVHVG